MVLSTRRQPPVTAAIGLSTWPGCVAHANTGPIVASDKTTRRVSQGLPARLQAPSSISAFANPSIPPIRIPATSCANTSGRRIVAWAKKELGLSTAAAKVRRTNVRGSPRPRIAAISRGQTAAAAPALLGWSLRVSQTLQHACLLFE